MKRTLALFLFAVMSLYAQSDAPKELNEIINTEDIKDSKAKNAIDAWSMEKFGLRPYRPNYLLPFGYTDFKYLSDPYTPTDGEYKHVEAEFQVSFKLAVKKNLMGLDEIYYVTYTQRSFWQLYVDSSPFRESNYNPEAFIFFPMSDKNSFGLKTIEAGYSHISNGQGNIDKTDNAALYPELVNRSRSLNTLFAKFTFQHESLIWSIKGWVPVASLDDNPDIMDYMGYGSLEAMYFYKKHLFTAMGRLNPFTQKGAAEFTYSYPGKLDGVYLYMKIFTGYGESLIDYNHNLTKYSIGFSFSR